MALNGLNTRNTLKILMKDIVLDLCWEIVNSEFKCRVKWYEVTKQFQEMLEFLER